MRGSPKFPSPLQAHPVLPERWRILIANTRSRYRSTLRIFFPKRALLRCFGLPGRGFNDCPAITLSYTGDFATVSYGSRGHAHVCTAAKQGAPTYRLGSAASLSRVVAGLKQMTPGEQAPGSASSVVGINARRSREPPLGATREPALAGTAWSDTLGPICWASRRRIDEP